jgi:hypothetical protein
VAAKLAAPQEGLSSMSKLISHGTEVALNQLANIYFSMERGMKTMNLLQVYYIKERFYEELEHVFDTYLKYHMKILLGVLHFDISS